MTTAGLLEHLRAHPPDFVAPHVRRLDASLAPKHATAHVAALDVAEIEHRVGCVCGHAEFRLLGVPTSMIDARRGYTVRSVLRLWRELQASASRDEGDPTPPLSPPLALDCSHCRARIELVSAADADAALASSHTSASRASSQRGPRASEPLEAHRCRPCRRSTFEVSLVFRHPELMVSGCEPGDTSHLGAEERFEGWRIIVRCRACGTLGEPFVWRLRTEQQRRIDQLYGRDEPGRRGETEEEP